MQLRITGLSPDTTNEDLTPLFDTIGAVERITVIRAIPSGTSKGYAIVWITDDRTGLAAIEKLNGVMVKSARITVGRMREMQPGEMDFREWLADNADAVLRKIGLKAGQTVLDYGCGPGIFTIPAAIVAGETGNVIAMDVRPQPLEKMREKARQAGLSNIRTVLANGNSLDTGLPDASADIILVFDMLHAVADKPALLREMHRVLRETGTLAIFPMHLGTARLLELIESNGLFRVRDRIAIPGFDSPSEVVNLVK